MKKAITILATLLLSACTGTLDGSKYEKIEPKFNLEAFFDGKVKAWGIVQNRSQEMVQRFEVDIIGARSGEALVLDETFTYGVGDGVEKRIWTINKNADNRYSGRAGDILGKATGNVFGNAMQWTYEMDLPVDDTTYRVTFDDWMWAFDENTLINRSYIKKFGFVVAEVTIFMQKQG
jgi:hypothetical protein